MFFLNSHLIDRAGFRSGDYKIVKLNNGNWELYNIKNDPTEMENLAEKIPENVDALSSHYNKIKFRLNINK